MHLWKRVDKNDRVILRECVTRQTEDQLSFQNARFFPADEEAFVVVHYTVKFSKYHVHAEP